MPLLKKAGGAIVNLSSVSGLIGGYNLAAYNASKGGVRLLTKSVALHGAKMKPPVRCNSVHPAFIEGPMTAEIMRGVPKPDETRARMERAIPLNRFGQAAEVADLCVYLLSDESAFVTGAELAIDGGLSAQ
jgi:NAD(P)-dependent dehydrogenase (short-subunit alcohol dehydrogenase family)